MCAIVDADVAHRFFGDPVDEELRPLWEWIASGSGVLVAGGRQLDELYRVGSAARALRNWERTRRARFVPRDAVEAETGNLARTNLCASNDHHVIALARVSGARLLCSQDKDLHTDFRNRELINDPRGAVYQYATQTHLLQHSRSCGFGSATVSR